MNPADGRPGIDYRLYTEAARRWLDGGGFYFPYQLTGPYGMEGAGGYAQPSVPSADLGAAGAVRILAGAALVGHPARRGRVGSLATPARALVVAGADILFGWATGPWLIVSGNPVMWSMAALAYATHRGWSGPLVLIKLTLAPFALMDLRDRPLVGDPRDCRPRLSRFPADVARLCDRIVELHSERRMDSLPDWPLMLGVVVAWVARTRGSPLPRAGLAA